MNSYRFALPRPTDILGLPIGQHLSIGSMLPGQTKEIVRSYTPVSSDEDVGHVDLLIKAYPTGNISKYVASLKIGDKIRVKGPKGAMVYTPNMVRHFGMIAGGTGITPMLQIIKAIERGRSAGDKTEVDLVFANVNADDILLKEDLDALAKKDPGFRVHYVLNNPPEGWTGGVGFVTADMLKVGPTARHWRHLLTSSGKIPRSRRRRQGAHLRPSAHGFGHEEGHRVAGLHQGPSRFQARGPSLLLLVRRRLSTIKTNCTRRRCRSTIDGA